MPSQELNNKIKIHRVIKNISQEELAIAIGVTRKTINTIETGKYIPSTVIALKIARYFQSLNSTTINQPERSPTSLFDSKNDSITQKNPPKTKVPGTTRTPSFFDNAKNDL